MFYSMTPRGFEPLIPPWKGGVLTAWPWSRIKKYKNELEQLSYCPISILITPRVGLEPTTTRLTAECSTIELSRKISCFISDLRECNAFSKSYKAKCEEIIYSFKTEHWNLISYISNFHPAFLSKTFGQALDRLVNVSWTHCCAYTSFLSTS